MKDHSVCTKFIVCLLGLRQATMELVRAECSFLLEERWKLMAIILQVINFLASLGRSQAGNLAIANITWYNSKVGKRSLDF